MMLRVQRATAVPTRAQAQQSQQSIRPVVASTSGGSASRRSLLSTAGLLALAAAAGGSATPPPANARDFQAALAAKEARKNKLKETAGDIRNSGKDRQVFKGSDYMVGEEARTPNVHSRQEEGARTQQNM